MESDHNLTPDQLLHFFFKEGNATTMPSGVEVEHWLPWTQEEKYNHPSYGHMEYLYMCWDEGKDSGKCFGLTQHFVCHKCGFLSEFSHHVDFGHEFDKIYTNANEHYPDNKGFAWMIEMEKHVNTCWQTHWRNPEWDKK